MRDEHVAQAVKSIRAIANLIEADPACLAAFSGKNGIVEHSELVSVLVQEFMIRLGHNVLQYDLPEKPA